MLLSIESRINRILKSINNFYSIKDPNFIHLIELYELSHILKIIGIYKNDHSTNIVIFTNDCVLIKKNEDIEKINYIEILEVKPITSKANIKGLNLILKYKNVIWLPVDGCKNDRFYDALEFIRLFNRIIDDLKSLKSEEQNEYFS